MTDAARVALLRAALERMVMYARRTCGVSDDPDYPEVQAALRALEATV